LGQVWTPPNVVEQMLKLRRNNGRILEPSAGCGAFFNAVKQMNRECVAIEIDKKIAPIDAKTIDFFDYPIDEKFDTIVGNPPYVRYQDICPQTLKLLKSDLFDGRSNLFLFFIEKCVRHLNIGGELIFIVPREFIKLTAAKKLNKWLFGQGSITHFIETGDSNIFGRFTPNCAIFRFEKGRFDRNMADGRRFAEINGQFAFLRGDYDLSFSDLFEVCVGGVSGADDIFTHSSGNLDFVYSKTAQTGKTRRMIYNTPHPRLEAYKDRLIDRRVRRFDESNWWQWGRAYPLSARPRVYVNVKTRRADPFFLHKSPHFDGSILALFLKNGEFSNDAMTDLTLALNREVDWKELGFVCDRRYLFSQRALQNCPLPSSFRRFLRSNVTPINLAQIRDKRRNDAVLAR
jgi:adenine-specific DNA-methyltransferase